MRPFAAVVPSEPRFHGSVPLRWARPPLWSTPKLRQSARTSATVRFVKEHRKCVGIDLGTTYSLVAVFENGAPRVIDAQGSGPLVPSVVGLDADKIVVGETARVRGVTTPGLVRSTFKRDMGTNHVYELAAQRLGPVECSALILKELRSIAEQELGTPVDRAVISVPAYFGERQRNATKAAAKLAGLEVMRLINEPTAAALAYGLHQTHREFKAVVLDLGGGTFDVTVLEMLEGVIEVQGSAGDVRLGGEDFLDALVRLVSARFASADALSVRDGARLREQLETVKRRLSNEADVVFEFKSLDGEQSLSTSISPGDTNAVWAPLVERMRGPVLRALRDAKTSAKDVHEVLLVGGATRMPCVAELARSLFGREPSYHLPPDEAVALGAAVQAALINDEAAVREVVMTDIAPFTLGVETGSKMGQRTVNGLFTPVLERGTLLPASRSNVFSPLEETQTKLELRIFQGEHSHCSNNTLLGTLTVDGLPREAGVDRSVEVRFTYDLSGVLEVDCKVLGTGKHTHCVLDQSGQLRADEVETIRARLQALKFHPRDALPNVTVLGKADALFAELTGTPRADLGELIARFRHALEEQEPKQITEQRKSLSEWLKLFERHRR